MKIVLIASNNAHKAVEIAEALDFPGWEFKTLQNKVCQRWRPPHT